jgi:hypothetical protein
MLIAKNSAGSLIGKHGSFIKQIKDESGAHIQISKQDESSERVVTIEGKSICEGRRASFTSLKSLKYFSIAYWKCKIEGDEDKRTKAIEIILSKIANDSYDDLNVLSYQDMRSNSKNDVSNSAIQQVNNNLLGYQSNLRKS